MVNQKRVAIREKLTEWLMVTGQVYYADQMCAVSFCVGYYGMVTNDHLEVIRDMVKDELLSV